MDSDCSASRYIAGDAWRTIDTETEAHQLLFVESPSHSLTASEEVCPVDYDSRAGGRGTPFPHHRKQDGCGKQREDESTALHP
jgi:hypothetical protein